METKMDKYTKKECDEFVDDMILKEDFHNKISILEFKQIIERLKKFLVKHNREHLIGRFDLVKKEILQIEKEVLNGE